MSSADPWSSSSVPSFESELHLASGVVLGKIGLVSNISRKESCAVRRWMTWLVDSLAVDANIFTSSSVVLSSASPITSDVVFTIRRSCAFRVVDRSLRWCVGALPWTLTGVVYDPRKTQSIIWRESLAVHKSEIACPPGLRIPQI